MVGGVGVLPKEPGRGLPGTPSCLAVALTRAWPPPGSHTGPLTSHTPSPRQALHARGLLLWVLGAECAAGIGLCPGHPKAPRRKKRNRTWFGKFPPLKFPALAGQAPGKARCVWCWGCQGLSSGCSEDKMGDRAGGPGSTAPRWEVVVGGQEI